MPFRRISKVPGSGAERRLCMLIPKTGPVFRNRRVWFLRRMALGVHPAQRPGSAGSSAISFVPLRYVPIAVIVACEGMFGKKNAGIVHEEYHPKPMFAPHEKSVKHVDMQCV